MPPIVVTMLALASLQETAPFERVVMPASGTVIEGLPGGESLRWEVEGTLVLGARDARPVDRLLGTDGAGRRRVTIEIRREKCPPAPAPGSTSPWPTLGYAGIRHAVAERRAVTSCKSPDLMLELRFPAGFGQAARDGDAELRGFGGGESDEVALLREADAWEPVVAALHKAYGMTRIDLLAAVAARDKVAIEAAEGAQADVVARVTEPMTLRSGAVIARAGDGLTWLLRDLGGHDVVTLLAPTGAGLSLQLLPFGLRYECDEAVAVALRSQPSAPPGTPPPASPKGWSAGHATGNAGVVLCAEGSSGGIVAVGGARVPREVWLPLATPLLERLKASITR
jgi:hypothetical protein